jgi:hypothetical protein
VPCKGTIKNRNNRIPNSSYIYLLLPFCLFSPSSLLEFISPPPPTRRDVTTGIGFNLGARFLLVCKEFLVAAYLSEDFALPSRRRHDSSQASVAHTTGDGGYLRDGTTSDREVRRPHQTVDRYYAQRTFKEADSIG